MRPENCRVSTEDLECVGCGYKLRCLEPGQCGHEDWDRQEAAAQLAKDKVEYERLKLLFKNQLV